MITFIKKSTITCLMLLSSTNILAQEYLCSFDQRGEIDDRHGFVGERIFSSDKPDINTLPCGEVDRKFVKFATSTSLPYGQINANWGNNGSLTIPNGNIKIQIYKVSRNDGRACTSLMEISTRGVNLYSGEPLSSFNVSTEGTGTSSYVLDKVYYIHEDGAWRASNNIALISSYNGTSKFSCSIN